MSKAQLVITAVVLEGRSKIVGSDYDVSRTWVQQLCQRYDAEGATAFEPRSRRPHHNPQAIDAELEERIVRLRKSLDKQGFDAGAATIASHLARDPQITKVPAVSTIWRILKRRGFVAPQPQKRPRSSWKRFCAELPNQLWQADVSHWRLADHTEVDILDIIDDHSRLAVASIARPTMTGPDVLDTFLAAFPQWGTPAGVLTDNGAIFTANTAATDAPPWRSPWPNSASNTATRGPTIRRPAARSNASTKPSKGAFGPYPQPKPSPSCNSRSTHSWSTTTAFARTEHCGAAPPSRPSTIDPRPSPAVTRSRRITACATTKSTPAASSPPCATTAAFTTSD